MINSSSVYTFYKFVVVYLKSLLVFFFEYCFNQFYILEKKQAERYLNELIPGSLECFESVPVDSSDGKKLFQMSFFLEGQIYSATSSSKVSIYFS